MNQLYKLLIMAFLSLLSIEALKSQTTVTYGYDNAGNRTSRTIKLPVAAQTTSSLKSGIDSTYFKEEIKENKLEEQIEDQKINIFPNPTHGALRVEIIGFNLTQQTAIRVYDLKGGLITTITPLTGNDIVDLSDRPLGIYVLKIQLGDKMSEWKIIKE